jgi:predicted cupin superfamily sugar epimerase
VTKEPGMNKLNTEEIIKRLGLQPLPLEGGYFKVTYTSDDTIEAEALPERYTSRHNMAGAIYFLETAEQFSAIHKLPTDEVYYYHMGDPLEMLFLHPDGSGEIHILGPDLAAGHQLQLVAPRDCWHGSRPLPEQKQGFSLCSTSMAPGYDDTDPVFADRDELLKTHSTFSTLIEALTRLSPHNI